MDQPTGSTGFERLATDWALVLTRGVILLLAGLFIAIASLFNPDGSIMHGSDFSWLPVSGFVIILSGLMESYEAYLSKELGRYFLHLQNGVLDLTAGCLIAFSISGSPERLSLLLVSYLIVKASLRILLANAIRLPQQRSLTIGASVSIILGLLMWAEWPSSAAWFMSLCLGIDVFLRGWSQTLFAFWLKEQPAPGP